MKTPDEFLEAVRAAEAAGDPVAPVFIEHYTNKIIEVHDEAKSAGMDPWVAIARDHFVRVLTLSKAFEDEILLLREEVNAAHNEIIRLRALYEHRSPATPKEAGGEG